MQYNVLGNTGLVVSRMSLGTMTFTGGNNARPTVYKTDKASADVMVGKAFDAGVNFFDSADGYADGEAEEVLGAALKGRRDHAIITTKVGGRRGPQATNGGLSRRHMMWSLDRSLKRLGTDWLDVYVAHRDDPYTPLEETLSTFDEMVKSGKVRYIGFSNWSAWRISAAMEMQKANGLVPFSHGQMYYSVIGRDVELDVIPAMRHYGIGMTVWSPLAYGFLTGKYTKDNLKDPNFRLSGSDPMPFDKEKAFVAVERIRAIAQAHKASVAQVSLAWLLLNPTVASVIIGASTVAQFEENVGAAKLALTPDQIAELNALWPLPTLYPNWVNEVTKKELGPPAPKV
jgi:aryl-alcohol dehydrogenase-like predicted oxidoreductase